jgi:hypothetical protein
MVGYMHTNGQKISQVWITLTELSDIFGRTPAEIGLCLEELGLRSFDIEQHQFLPTPRAHERELCLLGHTRRKKKGTFYLWHKQNVSTLLQEGINLMPITQKDREDRARALQLLRYCQKKYHSSAGFDPLREVLLATAMPRIMAWFLIEAEKREKKDIYWFELIRLLAEDHLDIINEQLAMLGSEIFLHNGTYHPQEIWTGYDDCQICQAMKGREEETTD